MTKAIISNVSLVLLFPKDTNYTGSLNALYKEKDEQAYVKLSEQISIDPKEILYIDDSATNISAA